MRPFRFWQFPSLAELFRLQSNQLELRNELNHLNINEFEKVDLAFNYLLELEKWPKCTPVLTGSIFLVAEFIKFAKNQKF